MITRNQAQSKSTVYFHAFFPGVAAPTFTVQNRNVTSPRYQKYLDIVSGTWSTAPFSNLMQADMSGSGVYVSAAFDHRDHAETDADVYAVTFTSHGTPSLVECEIWTFGSMSATQLLEMHQYLLAQRVEISRPDSFTVQRRFFDAKLAGEEVLRFTSRQNTSGSEPEEVQTNESDLIPAAPAPITPIGLAAVAGHTRVDLTWIGTGASYYNIYRAAGTGDAVLLDTATTPAYTDLAVIDGIVYTYTVSSVSGSAESAASAPAVATPTGLPPVQVQGFTAVPGDGVVALSWTALAGATSYTVYRAASAGGITTAIGNVATATFNDTSVINDISYWYQVTATNTWGEGLPTPELVATPQAVIPETPTGLAAVAGNGSVSLSWVAGVNNAGFNVYRGIGADAPAFLATTVLAGYIDTGVVNGTIYSYTVSGIAGARESAQTAGVAAHPVGVPPAAAASLVVAAADAVVTLNWAAATGATSYRIMRADTTNPETEVGTSPTNSYADSSVVNGVTYTYSVIASNVWGDAAATDTAQATPDFATPETPTNLQALPGDGEVALTWTAGANNATFIVYRAENAASAVAYASTLTAELTDALVVNGVTYTYSVSGVNGTKESLRSNLASATPAGTPPAQVTGLVATPGQSTVGLTWDAATGATGYDVYRSAAGGAYVGIGTTTSTAYTDSTVTNGVSYSYHVIASNVWGAAAPSANASAAPMWAAPATPTGLMAMPGDGSVELTWVPEANNASFKVYRAEGAGAPVLIGSPAASTFTDSTAVNGTTYTYTVTGVNGTLESVPTAGVDARPVGPVPETVVNLVAVPGDATVSLTWDVSAGGTSYKIERSDAGAAFTLIDTVAVTSYVDSTVTNTVLYAYRVTATNTWGDATVSAEASATPTAP